MVWVGICRDCRMAIDPETPVKDRCSLGQAEIGGNIGNVTLVSQQSMFYSWCLIIIRSYFSVSNHGRMGVTS